MKVRRRLAVKIGSIPWMPRFLPQIVKGDNAIQSVTGHRTTLLDIADLPNITIKVPGRKSGITRTTQLLAVPDGEDWLIAGSYFGGPKMPAWVFNLRAAGTIEIVVSGESCAAEATELFDEEREAAWHKLRAIWPNFDLYEQRTERKIPVFRLHPHPAAEPKDQPGPAS
ncbi:nitroreductase family deazaflavin-dependent oxidoreductase [Gordonia sp. zg691]|uniref:Nitroreductase family deazaflavin-dependent oxidoreductase n=1 Tax=Gordonia jinghuaiqii TaxID=2758710 RepID=A0A7D7LP93_9ACTN|nr:nitroreductase family deazaflavin-dependent oxidoreductase [Gordonia jinghuaiqii]MBD0862667.1 nitroreductase family deazaflavin-dependent oxidoreductase [Gordonia jinghuaiqii]MCR5976749.1 nitroreductase family deazaflavin-dependent oxidoreductase [Gordonia jinghuaiqii]QMS99924.1 nitroreductase family deazaflavin-dependent oxidoreductase [Gordonia jinghuaiqii]